MNRNLSRALVATARANGGLLREAEAVALLGRPDALRVLVDTGYWREVLAGVLVAAMADCPPTLHELAAMAWAPGAVLSHYNAAKKEGFWVPDDDGTWITAPWESPARSRGGVTVVRTRQMPKIVRKQGWHKWTKPPRTIADLASHLTRNQLEAVLLSAVRHEKATAAEVDDAASALIRRPGISVLKELTALWTPERESMLEDKLHADVCAVAPYEVTRQHPVLRANGSVFARFDVAIPELMLAFEADGLLFHSTDAQIASDQVRDRWCMAQGWLIVRYREGTLDNHEQVRREVAAIIERRRRTFRAA